MPRPSTTDQRSQMVLDNMREGYQRKLQTLNYNCECLIRKLEQTMRECENALAGKPHSINSLGVIQGNGLDIDRQCAELRLLSDAIGNMQFVIGKEGGVEGQ